MKRNNLPELERGYSVPINPNKSHKSTVLLLVAGNLWNLASKIFLKSAAERGAMEVHCIHEQLLPNL